MRDISLKAILISSVFNFVLMTVLIVALGAIYATQFEGVNGGPADEAEVNAAFSASWFSMLALLAPIAAGYLAAAIAKTRALTHGALSASVNVIWGIFCMIFLMPFAWFNLAVLAANVLLGMLGGFIWMRRQSALRAT